MSKVKIVTWSTQGASKQSPEDYLLHNSSGISWWQVSKIQVNVVVRPVSYIDLRWSRARDAEQCMHVYVVAYYL